jgi:hypothetical protein
MARELPLEFSQFATMVDDGTGNGIARVTFGPVTFGTSWRIKRLVTTVNIDPLEVDATVQLRVYRLYETPSRLIDTSNSGIDDSSETDILLNTGEKLICVWTAPPEALMNSDPICTIIASGDTIYGR